MSHQPAVHLAIPANDLAAARAFYGEVLGLEEGRSSDHWIDWDFHGHQLVTHLVAGQIGPVGNSEVDSHHVPIPHFGLLLGLEEFHALAGRLQATDTDFLVDPYVRFPDQPGEQWTMFFRDPAGNALEFKSFRNPTRS